MTRRAEIEDPERKATRGGENLIPHEQISYRVAIRQEVLALSSLFLSFLSFVRPLTHPALKMTTFSRVLKKLEAPRPPGLTGSDAFLQNDDLLPVPVHHRKWKNWNYVTFWLADSFNINTFQIASAMVAAGLTWWQAWLCVWIGYSVAAVFLVLNAQPGAKYHILFPSYCRASFGTYGALWPVFNRSAMAAIWVSGQLTSTAPLRLAACRPCTTSHSYLLRLADFDLLPNPKFGVQSWVGAQW